MVESEHNIPVLINQFIATVGTDEQASNTYTDELSSLITTNQLSLLQFIQFLGPTLTSETDLIRSKSVQCLSFTIKKLDLEKLSKHDVNVLIDFYIYKIKDDQLSLQFGLIGISYLVECKGFLTSYIEKVLTVLEKEYQPKKLLAKYS